ncbi:MAG: acylphosphatase [Actinomycetota bacterium]|nr:acylphosphatase [Actinomycetota bacterium]
MVRRRVLISGRVQGVFFRDTCRREATQLGVAGGARNLTDGRVEATFEGEQDAVERLLEWCAHGPPRATVTEVEIFDEPPCGEKGFVIA